MNVDISPRIERFMAASEKRASTIKNGPKIANLMVAFCGLYKDEPLRRRQGLSFAYMLNHEAIHIGIGGHS